MSEIVSKINVKKSAEVHQLLPKIPDKKGTLLISLTVEPLRIKLIEYLNVKSLEHQILESSLKIEVDLLETFVLDIIDNFTLFNEIEMEAINILFLEDGEVLDFNTFGRTQSLSKIYRLIKGKDLIYILNNKTVENALIFTRTKRGADKVAKELVKDGIKAEAIHGNKSQGARERALKGFKNHSIRVLVATDIASRGIDVDKLSHVINFEIPEVAETYVHRIGRTGRAGASGIALSFCSNEEKAYFKDITKLIKKNIEVSTHPFS